jgi:pimeloyl-ACP methyl ester carboxylesterase
MSQFVEQIEALRRHLGLQRVALAGFSFGGIINRAYALAHPDRISALVILASYHDRSKAQREAVLARVEQTRSGGPAATIDAALERWFTVEFAAAHPQALEQVRDWVIANDPQVYPHLYHLMATCDEDYATSVANIVCPSLIVACAGDPGNTPAMAHALGALIPGARVEVFERLRHMGLYEEPETFLAQLTPFFAEHATG